MYIEVEIDKINTFSMWPSWNAMRHRECVDFTDFPMTGSREQTERVEPVQPGITSNISKEWAR